MQRSSGGLDVADPSVAVNTALHAGDRVPAFPEPPVSQPAYNLPAYDAPEPYYPPYAPPAPRLVKALDELRTIPALSPACRAVQLQIRHAYLLLRSGRQLPLGVDQLLSPPQVALRLRRDGLCGLA
jgi:hypothetical protein